MTRDEAIEAGARAIWGRSEYGDAPTFDEAATEQWRLVEIIRADVAAVLDAIGWAEPAGYVIAVDDRDQPGTVYGPAWPDLEGARGYAIRGERIWGLVPVEGASKLAGNS